MKEQEKPSVPGIVDPMLMKGTYSRAEIMAEVRRLRPDFKDPSAAVSNGMRRCAGKGTVKDAPRERGSANMGTIGREASLDRWFKRRMAALDAWVERTDAEVSAGFRRLAEFQAVEAKRPRLHRVWP